MVLITIVNAVYQSIYDVWGPHIVENPIEKSLTKWRNVTSNGFTIFFYCFINLSLFNIPRETRGGPAGCEVRGALPQNAR